VEIMNNHAGTMVDLLMPPGVAELVNNLWIADQDPASEPLQTPEQFQLAGNWLGRVLLDTQALLGHIRLLERHYGERFPFVPAPGGPWPEQFSLLPSHLLDPAWPGWWQGAAAEQSSANAFSPMQPFSWEQALAVARNGPEELTRQELAALLLSPIVLCDLAERISTDLPSYWLPRMDEIGQELMQLYRRETAHSHPRPPTEEKSGEDTHIASATEEDTKVQLPKKPRPPA
jgi:hypothetical protein